jgi:tRNA nucleotidyltransferase/poly(A) polymerase
MRNMKELIPEKLNKLASECRATLYVVGGVCRDVLAGLEPANYSNNGEARTQSVEEEPTQAGRKNLEGKSKEVAQCEVKSSEKTTKRDWDICAGVEPDEVIVLAERLGMVATAVYRNTGTVKLSDGENEYEFTSFRSDTYVRGVHQPVETTFTTDIVQDAKRRDFKANAVYYDIKNDTFVDPLGGIADITARRMTTVREAERVFGEDGLRLMRLARQCAVLGFTPSDECLAGAKANAVLIADISAERIWAEMNAILHADEKYGIPDAPYRGLHLLRDMGVLAHILPELTLGDGMEQRRDYHNYDVLEHSFRCVKYARSDIRLAALLHDVGKPACKLSTGKFAEHELVGEKIAREVLTRWKVGKKLTDETCRLVRWHMYDFNGCTRQNKVRRVIVENLDIFDKLLALKQADFSACKDNLTEAPIVTRWRAIYTAMQVEGVPLCLKQLAVRGDELIKQGIPPEKVGKILQQLLWECVQSSLHNDRDSLIKRAKQLGEI